MTQLQKLALERIDKINGELHSIIIIPSEAERRSDGIFLGNPEYKEIKALLKEQDQLLSALWGEEYRFDEFTGEEQ